VTTLAVFRPTCAVCFKLCRLKCALLLSTYSANMTWQPGRLHGNFRVAIICKAWWRNRAHFVVCSSWATYVFVKRFFNLSNVGLLNFKNTWFVVSRQKLFCGSQVEKPWGKWLKPSGAAYRRLKANTEENLTKYARSMYA